MSKVFWGNATWSFLHRIAYLRDVVQSLSFTKIELEVLLLAMSSVLPCDECKINLKGEILVVKASGKEYFSLFEMTVDIHNSVNLRLSKYQPTLSEVREQHDREYEENEELYIHKLRVDSIIMLGSMALAHTNPSPISKIAMAEMWRYVGEFVFPESLPAFLELNDIRGYTTDKNKLFYLLSVFSEKNYPLFRGQRYPVFREYFEKQLAPSGVEGGVGSSCGFCN